MKTRILYTRFWHDNYISDLNPKEKLTFVYLITNEKVNICGIYELPDKYVKFDLGLRQTELDKIKQKFMEDGKFVFIDGWIKILNYETYNRFVGEKNEKAKENELALIPIKIKDFRYPIDRVSSNGDTLNSINQSINKKEGDCKGGKTTKKKYNDEVSLTEEEYQKLVTELSESVAKEYIKDLSLYLQSSGKRYKSHYATILTWHRKDEKEGKVRRPQDSESQPKYIPKKEPAMTPEQIARNKANAKELMNKFSGKFDMPGNNPQAVGEVGEKGVNK